MQALIAYSVVAAAATYAAWILMPQQLRRWLASRLCTVVPVARRGWMARLEKAGHESGCSTCKGCAADVTPAATQMRVVEIHRRRRN